MADQKLSTLSAITGLTDTDIFYVVDNPESTDVSAKITWLSIKRSGYGLAPISDADYNILTTDLVVAQTGTMTAPRAFTLPLANAVPAGYRVTVFDKSNTATVTNTLTVNVSGSDHINAGTSIAITTGYVARHFISDGTATWICPLDNVGSVPGTVAAGDDPRFDEAARTEDLGQGAFADFGAIEGSIMEGNDPRVVNANLYTYATFSNAAYTATIDDRMIAQIGTMSAARILTMPLAASYNPGETVSVIDVSGTVTVTNCITVTPSGSDVINGRTSHKIIQSYEVFDYISDGVSKWTRSGNHYGAIVLGDGSYTAINEDKVIAFGTTLTATRTVTLPDVANLPIGYQIAVLDANAAINGAFFITVQGTSGQTLNGNSTATLNFPRAAIVFYNTGFSWKYDARKLTRKTAVSNANYTVLTNDSYVVQTGTMSASRTITLPAANSVAAGYEIIIGDESGTVTSSNTLVIARAASDTIDGATSETISAAYGMRRLFSDGTSKWTFDKGVLRASSNLGDVADAPTARTNLGVDTISRVKLNYAGFF